MTKVKINLKSKQKQNWKAVSKHWYKIELNKTTKQEDDLNLVFPNHEEGDKIYPLTIIEIAEAKKQD